MAKNFEKGKMVSVPSHSIIPERDIDKRPILECVHLGIDFGGLRAVDDFTLTIGRTEIAGAVLADAFDCTDGIAKDWNINGEDVTITVAKI